MKPLLTRVVLLLVLLGGYGSLQPAEVEGQPGSGRRCWTCGSWNGWAQCYPIYDPSGWDYCQAVTQDPTDPSKSYCELGWYCPWWAA